MPSTTPIDSGHPPLRATLPPSLVDGSDHAGPLLAAVMSSARLALWEAWQDNAELIRLDFGDGARPSLPLEATQMAPGTVWFENIYPSDRALLETLLASADPSRARRAVEYRLIVAEGELLWVRHSILQRSPAEGGRRRLLGLIMPIPEQKQLEWECLRVSERESNRIGQELHDDVCQMLAGLTFMMHVIGRRVARDMPDIAAEMGELNAQLQGATERVRAMAHGLFPAPIHDATLRDTFIQLGKQSRTRFGVRCEVELPKRIPTHASEHIVHIFRIAQEAIGNAVRHGGATQVTLTMQIDGPAAQLDIEDNGRGFPSTSSRREGIGMHVMQYRAHMLGGTVTFRNRSPRGAWVQLKYSVPGALARGHANDPTT